MFKTLEFHPEGLTLIVGDGSAEKKAEGSSNGVGKTLALGLVHHCLGATVDAKLKSAVGDWLFVLTFCVGQREHRIERSGDGRILKLDGSPRSATELRGWLNQCGAFRMDESLSGISFRSLFRRFARHDRLDCVDPCRTAKEPDFDAHLRSLYLLGIDCSLAMSKRNHKLELDRNKKRRETWQHDEILKNLFRTGAQPKVRAEWLDREIPRLRTDLETFQIAEDYRSIELEASDLTRKLRQFEHQMAILRFQLDGIEKALARQPDISRNDLLELYQGLQAIFRPEVLTHLENVEGFHRTLAANRQARLEQDRLRLGGELNALEKLRGTTARQRDESLQRIHGKRALDEYAALARQLADLEEERGRLDDYLQMNANLQKEAQEIKERKVEEDRLAGDYLQAKPEARADRFFRSLAERLYPRSPAGIVLENNLGENQLRFDMAVQIEGEDSDGINAARILCFDWVVLMHGANHAMDVLWHDNRLFADIDPRPRAAWFRHTLCALPGTGKQYVATLNTENFDAMQEHLTPDEQTMLRHAVRLTLRGDRPEHKLLGVQFGS